MAFKFPFTNYHELNLTWVLEQLKKLFEESEENVETIETYDDRLSAVESEVSTLETTTSQAINTANAAATNAATALSRANTANENALSASSQAGAAVTAAQGALQEAQAATQAAQQAQATAMTFDGRITQAQNDASAAVHEAESFENRVNAAINTANNAANTATIAQGIAVNANQTAAQALDELNAQRDELESIADGLIDDINNEADAEKQDIQNLADTVIASIPSDYTQLSADVKNKAPVIVANASGEIASFKDGANDMEIRHLLATINPIQAGTGEPSPSNVRAISGRTALSGVRDGKNLFDGTVVNMAYDGDHIVTGSSYRGIYSKVVGGNTYTVSRRAIESNRFRVVATAEIPNSNVKIVGTPVDSDNSLYAVINVPETANYIFVYLSNQSGTISPNNYQFELGSAATEYEAYQNQNISVNWQTEAGTVYGGTLDVVAGLLTIDRALVTINGTNYPTGITSSAASETALVQTIVPNIALVDVYNNEKVISDYLPSTSDHTIYRESSPAIAIHYSVESAGRRLWYRLPNIITEADAKTYLANNPLTVVYEISNPQTVQLDPVTVKTLLGYNNIYTDCGPVSVDYPADTKLYIDGKFAELQALVLEH